MATATMSPRFPQKRAARFVRTGPLAKSLRTLELSARVSPATARVSGREAKGGKESAALRHRAMLARGAGSVKLGLGDQERERSRDDRGARTRLLLGGRGRGPEIGGDEIDPVRE